MSRLSVMTGAKMRTAGETIRGQFVQRIAATPPGVCAVEQTQSILKVCHAQSCGKCVPCRDGLEMLENILEDILDNKGTMASLTLLKQTAENIKLTADCAIGAHAGKKLNLQGEDCTNVISAVEMLRAIGDGDYPDYTGKRVIVIGGGNVAMDCARTAIRANARSVGIVYRRRQDDMTAQASEIESAVAEGVELITLKAPLRIEANEKNEVSGLWVQPQMIGVVKDGRPAPKDANKPEEKIECDIILVAIGQDILSGPFAEYGIPVKRGRIQADRTGGISHVDGIFAGGECVSGPATVIRAIEGGKVAAANIDEYLGFSHPITCDVEIPEPLLNDKSPCGRANLREREAWDRKTDFEGVELPMSSEEAMEEASRCLRCDRHGCANLRGGRKEIW